MQKWLKLCWPPLAAAGILLVVLASPFNAQERKHGNKELYGSLRVVINTGADMYNLRGDHAGCYRLWQGALLSVRPFLEADLQKEINAGLAKAEQLPSMSDRAFELRRVIDLVRSHVKDGGVTPPKDKTDKPADKKDVVKPKDKKDAAKDKDKKAAKTLWDRLGGEDNVAKVVDDFVAAAGADPKVNVSRNGKFKVNPDELKIQLIAFISQHTGGPYKYTGKTMKEAHKGMAITDAEFDAAGMHLKNALEKHKAAPADVAALMTALGAMRKDIVEAAPKDGVKKDGAKKDKVSKDAPEKNNDVKKDKDASKKVDPPVKTGKLSGKATMDGKPLALAYVTFVGDGNRKFTTLVKDGTYSFRTPLPEGQYRIYVEPAGGEGVQVAVPERYRAASTSGLTVRVEGAQMTFDITLAN